jgi:NAD(P)-dependent dehydrogenase (short-subunit alcohol dehydrogenase family)
MHLLRDKVCVIVGAGSLRGIGYATAELFARHGARLAVVDVTMDDGITEAIRAAIAGANGADPDLTGLACDIQHAAQCDRVIDAVVQKFGTIDCLVNSAGIVKAQSLLSIAETDYDRILDVNLKGTFNICKSTLRVFADQKRGAIVNLASVAAQRGGGLVGGAHYKASDIAGACLFLVSDLSAYVTGTTLDVNGGSHIH